MRRPRFALALALPIALAACSGSDPSTIDVPNGSPSSASTARAQTVEVTYANGAVTPRGYTAHVKLGTKVHLVVHSDVADEVHVHTYDKKAEVTGGVATIDFNADIPGLFEIELESHSYTLLHLQVG